jgi:hypothetical protein
MHQLPHLHSRVKHERGVSQVGAMEPGRAYLPQRNARQGSGLNCAHGLKNLVSARLVF